MAAPPPMLSFYLCVARMYNSGHWELSNSLFDLQAVQCEHSKHLLFMMVPNHPPEEQGLVLPTSRSWPDCVRAAVGYVSGSAEHAYGRICVTFGLNNLMRPLLGGVFPAMYDILDLRLQGVIPKASDREGFNRERCKWLTNAPASRDHPLYFLEDFYLGKHF